MLLLRFAWQFSSRDFLAAVHQKCDKTKGASAHGSGCVQKYQLLFTERQGVKTNALLTKQNPIEAGHDSEGLRFCLENTHSYQKEK